MYYGCVMGGRFAHKQPRHGHVPDKLLVRAASLFRAAGSFERLRLLECLQDGEACVTGLAEHLGQRVTTTSNQLQALAREGLVAKRKSERHRYYRLADPRVAQLLELVLDHVRHQQLDSQ